jgi:peptidoglycan/LPS O-acetylase OafA/YrhL
MTAVPGREVHGRTLPALDGLRAVAALLVVGFHVALDTYPLSIGWAGVPVFFVLSGYLITRLARADEAGDGFSFRSFWIRRTTRIVPLYLLALAAFMALPFVGDGGGGDTVARTLPYYLTFNGEFVDDGPMSVAWSLGIEEKFYLVWPVVAFALLARRRSRLGVTAFTTVLCLLVAVLTDVPHVDGYAALLVGASLALLEDRRGWDRGERPVLLARPVAGWLAAGAVVASLLAADLPSDDGWVYVTLGLSVAALVAHLAHGRSLLTRALAAGPMRWLGRRSYGIYLLHTLALTVVEKAVPGGTPARALLVAAGCLALTLVASDLAHRSVEVPFIRLGRSWSSRSRGTRAADPAGAVPRSRAGGDGPADAGWPDPAPAVRGRVLSGADAGPVARG